MKKYIPKVNDSVIARKLIPVKNYVKNSGNLIIGKVIGISDTTVNIVTNINTEIEGDFTLNLVDYNFEFLYNECLELLLRAKDSVKILAIQESEINSPVEKYRVLLSDIETYINNA